MISSHNSIKLTDRQSLLLQAIELDARTPLSNVAHSLRMRHHSAVSEYSRLRELGVLQGVIPLINVSTLGLEEWCCFLTLSCDNDSIRKTAEIWIGKHPAVSWFAQAGGSYQYFISFCVEGSQTIADFFDALAMKFGPIIQAKHLATITDFAVFGKKYLNDKKNSLILRYKKESQEVPSFTLDQTDQRILNEIANPTFLSARASAEVLKIPSSTFERRLSLLKERGIIVGFVHTVHTRALGIQTYKVLIFTRGMLPANKIRFFRWAAEHPNVVTYIACVGPWDIELRVEVLAAENAAEVTRDLLDHFGREIISIELVPLFGFLKARNFPYLRQ